MQICNASISLEAFGLKGEGGILGFERGGLSEAAASLIPKADPNYVFDKDTLGIMAAWWEMALDEPLFVSGPHGSGKTSFVNQFCARVNAPVISMTSRARLDRADLIGSYIIGKDKTMTFVDGPLTRAWRHGCVLLINEMSAAPADLWLSVNELLEGAPLFIEATGEVIEKHPGARIVMTDNLRGLTEESRCSYIGRFTQDPAVLDRFWKMRMDYMDASSEIALLEASTPRVQVRGIGFEAWRKEFCLRLRKAAERVRDAHCGVDSKVRADATISTRVLLRFRDLLLLSFRSPALKGKNREAIQRAMRIALTDSLEPAGAITIEKLVEFELGDIGRHLAVD